LCTGSGVQSILASSYSKSVDAMDINERAIQYTLFNIQLNNVNNVTCMTSDIYDKLTGQKFDLILANPPSEISFKKSSAYRDGGLQGTTVLEKILKGLPYVLKSSGLCEIVTKLPNLSNLPRHKFFYQCLNQGNYKIRYLEFTRTDMFQNIINDIFWNGSMNGLKNIKSDIKKLVYLYKKNKIKNIGYGILKIRAAKKYSYKEKTFTNAIKLPTTTRSQIEEMMREA